MSEARGPDDNEALRVGGRNFKARVSHNSIKSTAVSAHALQPACCVHANSSQRALKVVDAAG